MAKEKDQEYEKVKKLVDIRDKKQCQFMRCLSITEARQLKISQPKNIDRCHIFPRGAYPELIYNSNNIISLQRYIHQRMDNFKNPLDGENIDNNYHWYWWWRIVNRKIEKYNHEIDYEIKLLERIKC